jgi:hypothetical protein
MPPVYKIVVIKKLQELTGHEIGRRLLISIKGKSRFADFYDITLNKYRRCTIKGGSTVINIRDIRSRSKITLDY